MPIAFIDPLSDPLYDLFVNSHPRATFFHTSVWARVLHDTYGFKPASVAMMEKGRIRGLFPYMITRGITGKRRCVSMPFSDFCEPLIDDANDFQNLFDAVVGQARENRWGFIQLRGGERFLSKEIPSDLILTHDIDLTGSEKEIFTSLRESTRRNIRKAEKSGVTLRHESGEQAAREFYRLNCLTRKGHGVPPQSWNFFNNIQTDILSKKMGFITLAEFNGVCIAADVFLISNKKAIYKYGASDKAFQHLRASNLVMWEGIKQCRSLGCQSLNLGRTETHHAGLVQFKQGFTRNESKIKYYRYSMEKKKFMGGGSTQPNIMMTKVLSALPIPLLKKIGELYYRYAL